MLHLFQGMGRDHPLLLLGLRGLPPRCWGVQLHDLADLLPLRAAGRYHLGLLLLQLTHRDHRAFNPPRLTAPRRRLQTVLQLQPGARALGRTAVVAAVLHLALVTDPAHHHMHMVIGVADHHPRVLLETHEL